MTGTKNDTDMTGVLYGGVQGFWVRRNITITTINMGKDERDDH